MPEGKRWRALVLFEPGVDPGPIWQFGCTVARANNGEVVALVVVPEGITEGALLAARETLEKAVSDPIDDEKMYRLLVEASDYSKALNQVVDDADIDLLLAEASPRWPGVERIPCAVGVIRGGLYQDFVDEDEEVPEAEPDDQDENGIRSILVPTSAGPNSAHALSLVLPLNQRTKITALYVAPTYMGPPEEALGRSRLNQLLRFIDAGDRIERKVIQANSVTEGIVAEARKGYDLVLIGATRESPFDRALFGDVVGSVIRESRTPVIVVREPNSRLGSLARGLAWRMRHVVPRLTTQQRAQVYVRVRRSARPSPDFFILIALSAAIAALGLLLSSPAVVIGAMLVAPLMSPMIGVGMAMVLGDTRFLRLSIGAVVRGVALAILVGALSGLLRLDADLTAEVLSRTQPNLLDLGVALFAGLAGAYAITESDAAAALPGVAISAALVPPLASSGIALSTGNFPESGGAFLLFVANFSAIVFASILVFLSRGFRPSAAQKDRRSVQERTVGAAVIMLIFVSAVLVLFTFSLTRQAQMERMVYTVTEEQLAEVAGAELVNLNVIDLQDDELPLTLEIVAQSENVIPFSVVKALQDQIAGELQPVLSAGKEVQLTMTVIRVTKLDPVVPPTPTTTPTATDTATPGPTPTSTSTSSPTPTGTPAASATNTPTGTPTETPLPTETPSPGPTDTPTLATALVNSPYGVNLRAAPLATGAVLTIIPDGAVVELLPGRETVNTTTWQQVRFEELEGWVVADLLIPQE